MQLLLAEKRIALAVLRTGIAIIVTAENQQYHYDSGVYYVQVNGGYNVIPAPVGETIVTLP